MRVNHTETDRLVASRIAAEVRAEMGRQNMSQQALADQLGWPQNRVSRRLNGGAALTPFTVIELMAVAAVLDVPMANFLPEAAATPP